jgi:hypothetical protein
MDIKSRIRNVPTENHQNVGLGKDDFIDKKTNKSGTTFVITFFGEV